MSSGTKWPPCGRLGRMECGHHDRLAACCPHAHACWPGRPLTDVEGHLVDLVLQRLAALNRVAGGVLGAAPVLWLDAVLLQAAGDLYGALRVTCTGGRGKGRLLVRSEGLAEVCTAHGCCTMGRLRRSPRCLTVCTGRGVDRKLRHTTGAVSAVSTHGVSTVSTHGCTRTWTGGA